MIRSAPTSERLDTPRSESMAHILLVDDDPASVARTTETIETQGHSVSASSTAAEASRSVRREVPDLVVMEAVLGGKLSGLDLARSLAKDHPDLPLIMLTRADDLLSSEQLDSQDRDGWIPVRRYLEKPVLDDVLAYEIDHLLPEAE
jgi:CheY-like chemotaxis protein